MAYPFRYINETIGTIMILVVLLITTGLFYAVGAHKWFEAEQRIQVLLPEDGSNGLREDADVLILGTLAGWVEEITIGPQGEMVAAVNLKPEFYQLVSSDSRVIIRRDFSLISNAYLDISKGSGTPLNYNTRLQASAEKDLKTVATEILEQVERSTFPALQAVTQLAIELKEPDGPMQQLLLNTNIIVKKLDQGQGLIPRLLNDEALSAEFEQALVRSSETLIRLQQTLDRIDTNANRVGHAADHLDQGLTKLPQTMRLTEQLLKDSQIVVHDLKRATERLPGITQTLDDQMSALPILLLQTTQTLQEIERLIMGLQRHWLIRDNIEPQEAPTRIPTDRIGGERAKP